MSRLTLRERIQAPADVVFDAVGHIDTTQQAVDRIEAVEFLTAERRGRGVRFRETRRAFGTRAQTVLEVTEYEAPKRVRLLADSHGTVWDTLYEVVGDERSATLHVTVEARSHKLLAKLTNRMLTGLVKNNITSDLADIRRWCERQ